MRLRARIRDSFSSLIAVLLLAGILADVRAAGYDFLELHLPNPLDSGSGAPAPFHLVFPDTIGGIWVRGFLEAPRDRAVGMLSASRIRLRPLGREEKLFLSALRDMVDGRLADCHKAMAAAVNGRLPARHKECVRIDAALLLYLSGMPDEAEKDWRRAIRNAAEAPGEDAVAGPVEGAWRNLFSLYLTRRDFSRAHALVDETLESSPGNRWAQMAKGFLLRMLGSGEEWERYLRDKSSWKDSLYSIQVAYGKFLADRGQWEEAAKYYNRGLDGAPRNGPAWLELAEIYYRLGYLVFAEQCIISAFRFGISDPYIFELYGKVLVGFADLADTSGAMRGLGFRMDTAWASSQWRRAEKVVEDGFPKALESRSMAQFLYRLYCRNGRVEAARNLREDFWFHFVGPPPLSRPRTLLEPSHYWGGNRPGAGGRVLEVFAGPSPRLRPGWTYVTFPWVLRLQSSDFFEIF